MSAPPLTTDLPEYEHAGVGHFSRIDRHGVVEPLGLRDSIFKAGVVRDGVVYNCNFVNCTGGVADSQHNGVGATSTSVGQNSLVTQASSLAVGFGSQCTVLPDATALGINAQASNSNAIAIGTGAVSAGANSILVGTNSNVTGHDNVVIQVTSLVTNNQCIVIGNTAVAFGDSCVAVGYSARCEPTECVSVGAQAACRGGVLSVAMGFNAQVNNGSSVGIGGNVTVPSTKSVAIGEGATVGAGDYCTSVGADSSCTTTGAVAIGRLAQANGAYSVGLGYQAQPSGDGHIFLGGPQATQFFLGRLGTVTLGNYANDVAAALGGVPINGLYRNASVVQVRVT